tara:strand:- start:414 stop:1361 length:948 start_codon:yes stop_codon:yes gene_type:complete
MKRILLTGLLALPILLMAQTVVVSDNFDNYTAGSTITTESAGVWDTWSGGGGTAEDAEISTAQANSGSNSMNVYNGGAGVYLHDVILEFPSVYTAGIVEFSCEIYVAAGSAGYFNLGSVWASGGAGYEYGADFFFNGDGSGYVSTAGNGPFTYTQDAWVSVSVVVDLGTSMVELSIDAASVYTGAWGAAGGFGVADVFGVGYSDATGATEIGSNFFMDDVVVKDWTGVGIGEINPIGMNIVPNPSNGQFLINLNDINNGEYSLSVVDMMGKTVHKENLNVAGNSSLSYDLDLASGVYFVNINNGFTTTTQKMVIK